MKKKKFIIFNAWILIFCLLFAGCQQNENQHGEKQAESDQVVKLGYFANITHAQGIIGVQNGEFQKALGENATIETKTFNAGPAEIEALFAGEIDIGYIGPSPAVNGYIKSEGESLRIISGVVSGGASLIGTPELAEAFKIQGAKALEGKKIASPQQGNTQDISLRHYIKSNSLKNVEIVPITNADQLTMFMQGELDGSWAPEPWATRLIKEANGVLMIDERNLWDNKEFCVANIIVSTKFLNDHPDLVKKFLRAHADLTDWIIANPEEAQIIVNSEIERLTSKKLQDEVLSSAWKMLDFTVDPLQDSVYTFADWADEEGFLSAESKQINPDLTNLYDLKIFNEVTGNKY